MKNSKISKKAKTFLDGLQKYRDGGMQVPLPEYQMAGLAGPNGQPIDLINYTPPILGPTMPIGQQPPMQMLQPRTPIAPLQPLASLPLTPVQSSNPFKLPDITVEDKQPKPNFNALPVIGSAITLGMGIKEGVESYQAKKRADRLRGYFDQDLAERKKDISLGEYVNTPYSQYQDGGIKLGESVSKFRATDSSQSGTTAGADKMEKAKLSAAQQKENQRILAERKARMERSKAAKGKPISAQQIADESAAIGDKFRVFPDDPNSVVDALNPLVMIGDMAAGLGQVPLNIQEGNYGQAAMNVSMPLLAGALAGGKNAAQLANNLINPLAGTGEFLTTQTPLRNVYKYNPFAIKENPEMFLYRTQPKDFVAGYTEEQFLKDLIADKTLKGEKVPFYLKGKLDQIKYNPEPFRKALDDYHGQWFDKNPERMDFYMKGRLDGDEGNILRLKVNKEEGQSYNLKNFPEAQKASLNYDTEFIVPKDKIKQAEVFSTNDWQKLIQEDNTFNRPNWLRGYKKVPKPLAGSNVSADFTKDAIRLGINDILKGRPLFETFPLTKSQKEKIIKKQNEEYKKAIDFTNDWFYQYVGVLRPEVKERIVNINPESEAYLSSRHYEPMKQTNNMLLEVNDEKISKLPKNVQEYIKGKEDHLGFNFDSGESLTFRNLGPYYRTPLDVAGVGAHELLHSSQRIGAPFYDWDTSYKWSSKISKYDPELKYYTSNESTELGKRFKNALVNPEKSNVGYSYNTWLSAPTELHSELGKARYKYAKNKNLKPYEMQNMSDSQIKDLIENYNLDKHFKKETPLKEKIELIKLLPAITGAAAVGASQKMQEVEELPRAKEGGIHIDPKNKGKFTAAAKRRGMGVQEFANKVMANKEDYSPLLVKRANFARNAAKWEDGGLYPTVSSDYNTTVELANQRQAQAMDLLQKMQEVEQLHKMMYGGMYQKGGKFPSWMNPKNWGVTDYSDKGDFNTAFFEAKKAGEEEFMYKDKRYNTKSDMTPEQQMKAYGITDNQRVLNPSEFRKNVGTIKTVSGYGTSIPYIVETALGTRKEDNSTNSPNSSLAKEQDALRLYLGLPQQSNTFRPSRYKKDAFELSGYNELLPNEMPSDEEINFYGKPLFLHELNKLKGTLKNKELANPAVAYNIKPMGDYVMGRHTVRKGKDDRGEYLEYIDNFDFDTYKYNDIPVGEIGDRFNKPYSIYGRKYYKDYGDGVKKAMYYTDKELFELDIDKKNFDTLALQRELGNRGYKLPKSTKKDGTFDGVMGDETKKALIEYRKSQDKQEFKSGGEMIKRADGSYSRRGLWDNIRANRGSGKKPTKEMLKQERKIRREEMEYGGYMPFMDSMDENNQYMDLPEFGNGGYKVERSNDRKGKTHKVTGPDGSVKYFGDPNMGERSKSKYGKEAFYARHKSNLEKNPHFRAYARATWQNGGQVGLEGFGQMYDNQQAYNQQTQQQFEDFYNRLNQQNVANWKNMKTSAINNIVSGVGGLATAGMGMPIAQKGGIPVSHMDSVRHQVGKIMKYEKERGSQYGTGLSNYGNPNLRPGASEEEAIDWTMQNILPKVKGVKTAMEKGEAIDFIYNSGKDPRIFAYQEYLRKVDPNNTKGWQDKDGNWKDRKTIPEPQLEMLYNTAFGNMKENDRRILMNKGRDWYYQNINVKPDGTPSDAYKNTWYGRIWNTNDYNEFDPNNPKFKAKMQSGGEYDPTLDVNSTQFDADAFMGREKGQPSELDALIEAEQAKQMQRNETEMELMNFIIEGADTGQANYSNLGMFASNPSSGSSSSSLAGAGEFANVIDEIRYRESRGNYGRVNDVSKTTGAYQFMPIWWADQIQDFMGIDPSASQEEVMEAFRTNPQAQDAFMVHVVNNIYKPQLPKLRPYAQKYGLNDEQLIKLMHYRGIGDAIKRLKTGDFSVSEKEKKIYNNPDVMEYLKGPLPK